MHARPALTVDAYFAMERAELEHRHEYWDGDIWAMTGTSPEHFELVLALVNHLREGLRGSEGRAYAESIRTRVSETKYVYPDVVVACPPDFDRSKQPPILQNPRVVVEVLSESTQSFDRGDKLAAYQRVASVTDVLLVSSDRVEAQHHRRLHDGSWNARILGPGDALTLDALAAPIPLDDLYAALAR